MDGDGHEVTCPFETFFMGRRGALWQYQLELGCMARVDQMSYLVNTGGLGRGVMVTMLVEIETVPPGYELYVYYDRLLLMAKACVLHQEDLCFDASM